MIGARIGARIGAKVGAAIGMGVDQIGVAASMAGVARDATSNIYCPATLAQWNSTMLVASIGSGGPGALHLCQEASGNLADSIGSFTLTASGTGLTYQSAVTGWSRFGIATTDAGTGQFSTSSASLPDPASGSYLIIAYYKLNAANTVIRTMTQIGTATGTFNRFSAADKLQGVSGANSGTGTGVPEGAVRPYVLLYDFTNNRAAAYSDQDKILFARGATTGKSLKWGVSDPGGALLYHVAFFNAAAELSDAAIKRLLQTLGWTVAWT